MVETLTVHDVADILQVTPATIYRWAKEGTLPSRKLGRSIRFTREAVNGVLGDLGAAGSAEGDGDHRGMSGEEPTSMDSIEVAAIRFVESLTDLIKAVREEE